MPLSPSTRAVAAASARTSPFGRLVTQGTFYTTGMQLSNSAVVLPFICAHQGITWAAGMLFPAYSIGLIMGNSASPAILQRAGRMRHVLLAMTAATVAALMIWDAVIPWTGVYAAAVFLLTTAAAGVVIAVATVAYTDMVSSKLPARRRGELFLTQGAAGSTLATGVMLLIAPMLASGDQIAHYRDLLWLGALALIASSVAALLVGPMRSASTTVRPPLREIYRQGFAVARDQPWFRRYAVTYLLFAPICLGTTFYSLRAAKKMGSLHVLVVLSSVGLVVGSAFWRKIYRRFGVRGMLLGSALCSTTAALVCIAAELSGQWYHLWAYGTVFLLATLAAQPVSAASVSWISVFAAEQHRATLIGFGATLLAITFTMLGGVLGMIAQEHATVWPVVVVLALSLVAAFVAVRAPGPMDDRAHDRSSRPQTGVPRLVLLGDCDGSALRRQTRRATASWQPEPVRPAAAAAAAS
ncbi:MFS transporter [Mycobacterium persicum]|uniref:MFS transporter n=1 Tax=Mycobacterium persicum TaxID=1487726 RepID=UPI0020D1DD6B|nr:MFS transporter [Mycobacterium persicum]